MPNWKQETTLRRIGLNDPDYNAGGNFNIFTITGGCLVVTGLFGHVTAASDGSATPLIRFTPTGGGAINDVCAVPGAVAWAINALLMFDGEVATNLLASIGLGHGAAGVEQFVGHLVFTPGVLSITNAGGADATLALDWYITYREGIEGVRIVAN